ncbi:MAG TPA: hypothetical protein VKA49_21340 [Flavitalea sp.]|nr:hypothetical protein [Flavitalea sp.]
MTKSKKPTRHREPGTKPDASLDRSSVTQEQNSPRPDGGTQEEVSGQNSLDMDGSQDFLRPKGMDT